MNLKRLGLLVLFLSIFTVTSLEAHEKRTVGDYTFVVGFVNEPAYSGQFNGIDLKIMKGEEPIEGAETTLKATLLSGEASRTIGLRKRHAKPGSYAGYFIPSKPGDYAFHIEGEILGQKVDETFSTKDGKFHAVGDANAITFP